MPNYTLIGIGCASAGNILISLALNFQKLAHKKISQALSIDANASNEATPLLRPTHSYLSSPFWWLGAVLMTIGESGNFIAYGFAPVSVVSPLGIVTIIANCTIAPLVFKEPVRPRDVAGTAFASLGVLLVILSTATAAPLSPNDPSQFIYSVLTSKRYLYYVLGCVVLASGLAVKIRSLEASLVPPYKPSEKTVYTLGNILLVAIFGAHTAMATKCLSTLIEFSGNVWRLFTEFQTYYLLAVLVGTAICQILFLNNSLRIESSTIVIPVHFVFFTISVLLGSAVVFKDQDNKQPWQVLVFFLGCIFTFVSVFLIAGGKSVVSGIAVKSSANHTAEIAIPPIIIETPSSPPRSPSLDIPSIRVPKISTSRSLPGELVDNEAIKSKTKRFLSRGRSFHRIEEFNDSSSELVGIPGSGSLLLGRVLAGSERV